MKNTTPLQFRAGLPTRNDKRGEKWRQKIKRNQQVFKRVKAQMRKEKSPEGAFFPNERGPRGGMGYKA